MRRGELVTAVPLNVVDDVAAVRASVQADRDEAGLLRHEPGALAHQLEHLGLMLRLDLHGRDLGDNTIGLADFGHGDAPGWNLCPINACPRAMVSWSTSRSCGIGMCSGFTRWRMSLSANRCPLGGTC